MISEDYCEEEIVYESTRNNPYTPPPRDDKYDITDVIASSSITPFWDQQSFDPYHKSLFRNMTMYEEPAFFMDYERCCTSNPYGMFLSSYVVTRTLGDGYHFEGHGAQKVEDFFKRDRTRAKLKMAYRDTVKFGSGLMDLRVKESVGRLTNTLVLDPFTFNITIETDPSKDDYGKRKYWQPRSDALLGPNPDGSLRSDRIFHMMMIESARDAWPMSLFRPNLVFLTGLMDSGGDVMEALKRIGFAPIIARLNLQGMKKEDKAKAIRDFGEALKNVQSSSNNFVIDREHEIDILGRGGGNAKLLPMNDLLEPWIAIALMNFSVPLGLLLQGGANKSIIESQREDARIALNDFRVNFKSQVEERIVPLITGNEPELVWDKPPFSSPDTQAEFALMIEAFKNGLVSREYVHDYFNIKDAGKTFYQMPEDPNQDAALQNQLKIAKIKPKTPGGFPSQ